MDLLIGGEARQFDAPLALSSLVERLGFAGRRIAVERNGEIVPRSRFDSTMLSSGDRLEIVTAVGGG
ncbi:MAG: sulfur carrier protein ThiS [Burkholderiales bacterium]|nr:sulfur carrier protein ThiS [Burkholderiales bacterium]